MVDWRGAMLCASHGSPPTCKWCDAFAVGGPSCVTPDRMNLCGTCAPSAVDSPERAAPLVGEVEGTLRAAYGLVLPRPVRVRLATYPVFLAETGDDRACGLTNTTGTIAPSGAIVRDVVDILMLWQMPRERFSSVLAHEMGHAWMAFKGFPPDLEPALEEGVAQLMAHLYLRTRHDAESSNLLFEIESRPDAVYGDGFRQVVQSADQHGLIPALRHIKISGRSL